MSAAETHLSGRRPGALRAWWRLFGSEIGLMLSRRRNQLGLLVLAGVPIVITLAVHYSTPHHGAGEGPDFVSQILSNGLFVPLAALTMEITMFLPLAISMLCGDAIAGEAHAGTLRYLLTVPAGRTRVLLTKLAALVVGCLIGAFLVSVVGAIAGCIVFGTGAMTTLSGLQIPFWTAAWRVLLATLYVAAGLAALAALGLFVSTLTEQPIAATVIVMILTMVMWILDALPQLDWLHPWLLVDKWPAFSDLVREPAVYDQMGRGLLVDLAYFVIFTLFAWANFNAKDITS